MKSLKTLGSVLLIALFALSCSSDSDNSIKIKYQIYELDNAVTEIKYTKPDGSTATLTDYTEFAGTGDSKTISVSHFPLTAKLEITVNNTTPNTKTYTLVIYDNNTPVDSTPMSVAPMSISTSSVDYIVEPE